MLAALFLQILTAKAAPPDFDSQADCIVYLEQLRNDRAADPLSALDAVNELIALSKTNAWPEANLYASTYKLELYVKQENISGAHALHTQLWPSAEKLGDPLIVARLMMANLKIKFARSDNEGIAALYEPLKKRAEESTSSAEQGEIHLALGLSAQGNMRLAEAIRSYKLAYDAFDSIDDSVSKALVLNSLADTYGVMRDTQRSIEYFKLALELHREVEDKFGESVVLYNLGRVYVTAEDFVLAEASYSAALKISQEIGDSIGVAWAQSALAKLALENERWEVALALGKKAEPVFAEAGDKQSQFESILYQSKAYLGAGDIAQAEQALSKCEALLPPVRTVSSYFEFLDLDSKIAAAKGDYERAYSSVEKKFQWVVERNRRDTEKQGQRYKAEFDTQLKEKQNEVLQKENELKELKILEQQRTQGVWILAIILAAVLLLFVATLLFFQTKNRNRFRALAMRDHLTDSPNRRAILQFAQERLDEAVRASIPLIIGIIDLDSFKKLNDTFGHDAGDEVLKNFALACSSALRKQDGFGRYGGEEWLVVFANTELSQIAAIFERVRDHLNKLPAKGIPEDHQVTFSMGVAQYHRATHKTLDALIKQADEKLYEAKGNGRNRFEA
ncbi:MAG: diguanylate cyclase [Gammaproteobacteria bacterium]